MAEIFLSYRRDDSTSATGRLADALEAHFGDDRVFRDREIAAGEDFVEAIRRSVESATVVLVVVGRHWLDARDAAGRRRLDDPGDFVRLEIELALGGARRGRAGARRGRDHAVGSRPAAVARRVLALPGDRALRHALAPRRRPADRDAAGALRDRSDAAPLSTAGESRTGALTRLASDVLDLAIHPKRLIARRQTGRASDYGRALAFLAAALLVGHVILLLGIDLPVGGGGSFAQTSTATAGLLLAGEFIGIIVVGGARPRRWALAWRIAGRRPGFARVGLVCAYVYGGAWIGFCIGGAVLGAGVELVDPGFVARAAEALQRLRVVERIGGDAARWKRATAA